MCDDFVMLKLSYCECQNTTYESKTPFQFVAVAASYYIVYCYMFLVVALNKRQNKTVHMASRQTKHLTPPSALFNRLTTIINKYIEWICGIVRLWIDIDPDRISNKFILSWTLIFFSWFYRVFFRDSEFISFSKYLYTEQ